MSPFNCRYLIAGHVGWVYLGWLVAVVGQEQGGVRDQLQLGVARQDLHVCVIVHLDQDTHLEQRRPDRAEAERSPGRGHDCSSKQAGTGWRGLATEGNWRIRRHSRISSEVELKDHKRADIAQI